MTALPDWDIASDSELASAAAAGDRRAFAEIYDRYADRLHDFCAGMVRDRDAAADCVQEVFCTAATTLPKLRETDKLRPWLYAIARNEALRHIRQHRREQVSDELPDTESGDAGPDALAARSELANLIAEAAGGLSDRDRAVLELAYRHSLDGPELAGALGVSPGTANKMVDRLRDTMERSLGALLVARRAHQNPNGCAQLCTVLHGWDGRFTILMRKRIARHIESCPICRQDRRELVNPAALLGAVPIFIPAPASLRERTLDQIYLAPRTPAEPEPGDKRIDADGPGHRTRRLLRTAMFVAATIALGLAIAWPHFRNASITPTAPLPTSGGPITTAASPNSPPPPSVADTAIRSVDTPQTISVWVPTSFASTTGTVAPPPATSQRTSSVVVTTTRATTSSPTSIPTITPSSTSLRHNRPPVGGGGGHLP